jgi:serine/threonine protein kinase
MRARLIDFGLSQTYLGDDKSHLPQVKLDNMVGSLFYCSINVMKFQTYSRRDDLISLIYMLIDLMDDFPLTDAQLAPLNLKQKYKKIFFKKEQLGHQAFFVGRRCRILSEFSKEVFKCNFSEIPYYSKLRHLLKVQLLNLDNLPNQDIFYDIKKQQNEFNNFSRETNLNDPDS